MLTEFFTAARPLTVAIGLSGLMATLLIGTGSGWAQSFDGSDLKALSGACSQDREKHCSEVKPGQGSVWKCLKEKEALLSADCKASLETKKKAN